MSVWTCPDSKWSHWLVGSTHILSELRIDGSSLVIHKLDMQQLGWLCGVKEWANFTFVFQSGICYSIWSDWRVTDDLITDWPLLVSCSQTTTQIFKNDKLIFICIVGCHRVAEVWSSPVLWLHCLNCEPEPAEPVRTSELWGDSDEQL